MKHWKSILLFVVVFSILVTACHKEAPEPNIQETENQEEKMVLSEAIQALSIWQHEGDSHQLILSFQDEMPSEPVKVAAHSLTSVHLTLKEKVETSVDQLKELVKVSGAEVEIRETEQAQQFQIVIRHIKDHAQLTLGDLHDIHLTKADHYLQFILNQSSLTLPYALLIHAHEEGSSHIFVSDQEEAVVIRFSEAMQRRPEPGTEWLSETQLRIHLQETGGVLKLDEYYSDVGNFVDRRLKSLVIHPIPSRTWLDAASGGNVGWSGRDGYYDYLLFSPNRHAYAGIIALTDDTQPAKKGIYYGIVIESQGQAPTVLDQTVYVNRPTTQLPIHWLDSRTLLFQSEDSAWRMDMETGRLQRVFEAGQDERLVTFQYDPSSERIYWLAEALREENGDQYWVGNLHIYNKDMELLERVEGISDLWPADHNTLLPLDLSIQESSLYITTFKDGKVVTYYELLDGNDDGSMDAIQLGRLIGTAEDGAFLAVNEDGDELLTWWMKDGETKPISSLGATNYMMFGGDLFALKEGRTNTYFIYSRSQDEWLEWSPNDGRDSWIPNQETAYYRITN